MSSMDETGSGCDISDVGCPSTGSNVIDDLLAASMTAQHSSDTRYVQLRAGRPPTERQSGLRVTGHRVRDLGGRVGSRVKSFDLVPSYGSRPMRAVPPAPKGLGSHDANIVNLLRLLITVSGFSDFTH